MKDLSVGQNITNRETTLLKAITPTLVRSPLLQLDLGLRSQLQNYVEGFGFGEKQSWPEMDLKSLLSPQALNSLKNLPNLKFQYSDENQQIQIDYQGQTIYVRLVHN